MTREEIVAAARGWIGTPFVEQATVKGHGGDCFGFIIGLARELGFSVEVDPYKQSPDGFTIRNLCRKYLKERHLRDMNIGDVVVITFDKFDQHGAILTDYPHGGFAIVHALKRRGGVVEHRLDPKWRACLTSAYSFPGI